MYNARDYGAAGVAREQRDLALHNYRFKWIGYAPGTVATIRHAPAGATLDSVGMQRAIDAAHAHGGGTVHVPAGDYLVAPLRLKSRVCLQLEPGARLWASPNLADYAAQANLFLAEDAEDVAIAGLGEIHGQSPQWVIPWMNGNPERWDTLSANRPGKLIVFSNCRRVAVTGIRIYDSPNWTLVFRRCRQVRVQGLLVRHFDTINADGIDLVDSSHVLISDCDLHVTDDGICLKNEPGDPAPLGVRNVAVTNCVIRTWCNGLKIGTESNGVFEDITFSNMVLHNQDDDLKGAEGGIHIALCDGGQVRNVAFRGVVMRNVECPFYLVTTPRRRYQAAYRTPRAGTLERVTIAGVRAEGARYTPFLVGCPEAPIRQLSLSDICIRKTAEFRPGPFADPVPACAQQYPTPFMFGSPDGGARDRGDGLPAHGLYLRDVAGLTLRGLAVASIAPDGRPLVVHANCRDLDLQDCRSAVAPGAPAQEPQP